MRMDSFSDHFTIATRDTPTHSQIIAKLSPTGERQIDQLQMLAEPSQSGLLDLAQINDEVLSRLNAITADTQFRVINTADGLTVDGSGETLAIVAGTTCTVETLDGERQFIFPSSWLQSLEQDS